MKKVKDFLPETATYGACGATSLKRVRACFVIIFEFLFCFYFQQQQQGSARFWRVLINMQIVVYHSESYVRMVYWFREGERGDSQRESVTGRKVE